MCSYSDGDGGDGDEGWRESFVLKDLKRQSQPPT